MKARIIILRPLLVLLFLSALFGGCSNRYPCGSPTGTTCMSVEEVLQSPPPGRARKKPGTGSAGSSLSLTPRSSHEEELKNISVIHREPPIIKIFSYKDREGVIHGSKEVALPPAPIEIEINRERW